VGRAAEIAAAADFLSIGTNDLTHSVLGSDRFAPGDAHSYHPEVLRAIAAIVAAATAQGRIVEVCGEAASDPVAMPLLIGLRVDELSVGAARVGPVRSWVRALRFGDVRVLTERALELGDAPEVENELKGVAALLAELDDAVGESLDGSLGVAPLGAQA
jgi:phosphoenolpyruvate-protein kinase (PTS system EI component)